VTDFERLLQALAAGGVEYILIGGLAANAHGAVRTTRDIDIVYARSVANLERLQKTLAPLRPYLRGAPPGLPFRLDVATLESGLNFTLTRTWESWIFSERSRAAAGTRIFFRSQTCSICSV
jgi:hypothetical protein